MKTLRIKENRYHGEFEIFKTGGKFYRTWDGDDYLSGIMEISGEKYIQFSKNILPKHNDEELIRQIHAQGITFDDLNLIRNKHKEGKTIEEIKCIYDLSREKVSYIINNPDFKL